MAVSVIVVVEMLILLLGGYGVCGILLDFKILFKSENIDTLC